MRCVRFAARFHFQIVDEAKQAILDPRIKDALRTKISKERIGAELDKMIDDQAGRSTAIKLIHDLGLYDVVFAPPVIDTTPRGTTALDGELEPVEDAFKLVWIMEWLLKINPGPVGQDELAGAKVYQAEIDLGQESLLAQTCGAAFADHLYPVVTTISSPTIPQILSKDEPFPEKIGTRNLILTGMIYPYRNMSATVNKKPVPAGSWIMRYGLKGKNQDIDIVTKLMECQEPVRNIVNTIQSTTQSTYPTSEEQSRRERADMGMVIRDIGNIGNAIIGKKWPCAFILALGIELLPKFDSLRSGILGTQRLLTFSFSPSFVLRIPF